MDFGIPSNFVAEIASSTTAGLSATSDITAIITGLLLAFLVLDLILGIFLVKSDRVV